MIMIFLGYCHTFSTDNKDMPILVASDPDPKPDPVPDLEHCYTV
jgi:hypothetical protein